MVAGGTPPVEHPSGSWSIEDEILSDDRRGISALRPLLPLDFVGRAAERLAQATGPVLIATGFYVAGAAETDGPPGAVAIGRALQRLGRSVYYVTDRYAGPLLRAIAGAGAPVLEVEIADQEASAGACQRIMEQVKPASLIAIERCGATADGRYLNRHGVDISAYTARLDSLFVQGIPSIGIGDGGNEIGMGRLHEAVRRSAELVREPTVTAVDHLIIASVSNWGGYGLVAALSILRGMDLLPSPQEAQAAIETIADLGAVDGCSGVPEYRVDGFSLSENLEKLARLRAITVAAIRQRGSAQR